MPTRSYWTFQQDGNGILLICEHFLAYSDSSSAKCLEVGVGGMTAVRAISIAAQLGSHHLTANGTAENWDDYIAIRMFSPKVTFYPRQ